MPASQVASPIPIPPPKREALGTASNDLIASINATLSSKGNQQPGLMRCIMENDYSVPAPPPPSPVSYASHWPAAPRR
ncbi:hypothetical protein IMZ48_17725 [Candidatus Bathyarchaeota archaeon]|nr:hypothetical protein [Candidatus Bathyarchaeota archaeon]